MAKHITAKVKLERTQSHQTGETILYFAPDYGDDRNKEWAKYTPALSLTMTVLDEVADNFRLGQPVTLTFEVED